MSNYQYPYFLTLILLFTSCSIFKDESNNKYVHNIKSVPEEIVSYRDRLNSLTDNQRKIPRKTIMVKLPDGSELEFIWIPATTSTEWKEISGGRDYYVMGDDLETYSPFRFVRVTYGFFIAKTEITQAQWQLIMKNNPSENKHINPDNLDNHPVNSVSWDDSISFIDKFNNDTYLSLLDRFKKYISYNDYIFRLPTEAEWEYAARAAMMNPAEDYLDKTTWSNSLGTANVAGKSPNPWGIHDIQGNVFELTQDCWPTSDDIKFGNKNKISTDPVGLSSHVNSRGGSYHSRDYHVKSFALRNKCNIKKHYNQNLGLRLVLAPPISKLNKAPAIKQKPRSILISEEKRPLQMISESKCNEHLKIKSAHVLEEYDRYILLDVCYDYTGRQPLSLAALTYLNGSNTGKWAYSPGIIKPGQDCTSVRLGNISLYAYSSDSILVKTHDYKCEAIFDFKKFWTNGTDVMTGQKTEDRPADQHTINTKSQTYESTEAAALSEQSLNYKHNRDSSDDIPSNLEENKLKLKLRDDSIIEFVWIPPTTSAKWKKISGGLDYYVYGDNLVRSSPYRLVKLNYGFFISKTEITQNQWEQVMYRNPSKNKSVKSYATQNLPVNNVSWNDALEFTSKFSKIISVDYVTHSYKNSKYEFRLPTEAEWEYAARAGMYIPDTEYLDNTAWYGDTHKSIQNAASKKPNHWGVHDMLGNVNEITHDCWPMSDEIRYGDPAKVRVNPVGSLSYVNFRGGTFYSTKQVKSFGWRSGCQHQTHKTYYLGARLVLAPPISTLNIEPDQQLDTDVFLVSTEKRQLNKQTSQKFKCDNQLKIERAYIIKEYNGHAIFDVCYDYDGSKDTWLSALTYSNGENTGKSGYLPGQIKTGKHCTEISLFKNSLYPYFSDSILINSYDNSCKIMFKFDKYWTNDTDIYRKSGNTDNDVNNTAIH